MVFECSLVFEVIERFGRYRRCATSPLPIWDERTSHEIYYHYYRRRMVNTGEGGITRSTGKIAQLDTALGAVWMVSRYSSSTWGMG